MDTYVKINFIDVITICFKEKKMENNLHFQYEELFNFV